MHAQRVRYKECRWHSIRNCHSDCITEPDTLPDCQLHPDTKRIWLGLRAQHCFDLGIEHWDEHPHSDIDCLSVTLASVVSLTGGHTSDAVNNVDALADSLTDADEDSVPVVNGHAELLADAFEHTVCERDLNELWLAQSTE